MPGKAQTLKKYIWYNNILVVMFKWNIICEFYYYNIFIFVAFI